MNPVIGFYWVPFAAFWVLLLLGRRELERGTILLFIVLWLAAIVLDSVLGTGGWLAMAVHAVLDIILVLLIFGGDIQLR